MATFLFFLIVIAVVLAVWRFIGAMHRTGHRLELGGDDYMLNAPPPRRSTK